MGALFGGGGRANQLQEQAAARESAATEKQNELVAKQDAEKATLKAEEDATKAQVEDRRRRMASGLLGRRSLFTADETGYARGSATLGAG
jgi:conjugal transfer/entry exclusion protein